MAELISILADLPGPESGKRVVPNHRKLFRSSMTMGIPTKKTDPKVEISPWPCWLIPRAGIVLAEDAMWLDKTKTVLWHNYIHTKIVSGKKTKKKQPRKQYTWNDWKRQTLQEPLASCTWNAWWNTSELIQTPSRPHSLMDNFHAGAVGQSPWHQTFAEATPDHRSQRSFWNISVRNFRRTESAVLFPLPGRRGAELYKIIPALLVQFITTQAG